MGCGARFDRRRERDRPGAATYAAAEIVAVADAENIAAVTIDAQLTTAVSDEQGFRLGDMFLRAMLPAGYRDWVASINSLMAVPVRGQMLAEALGATVDTILETHPLRVWKP